MSNRIYSKQPKSSFFKDSVLPCLLGAACGIAIAAVLVFNI